MTVFVATLLNRGKKKKVTDQGKSRNNKRLIKNIVR